MSDDSGIQFMGARSRKRPRQMAERSSNPGQTSHRRGEPSSSTVLNTPQPRPASPPLRYEGDGLDFRRPIMSSSPQTDDVIDLTNEPDSPAQTGQETASRRYTRPPRFGRNIMADVVDLEEDPPTQGEPTSPEVQFVGATSRPPPPQPIEPYVGPNLWQMLRLRRAAARQAAAGEEAFRQEVARRARQLRRDQGQEVDTLWIGDGQIDLTINLDSENPLIMEYPRSGYTPDNGPRTNSYKPPSPPPEGYTRKAGEDDVVVCPNCEVELGTGDETQQQIWVAKPCGHVYCGECARHRSLSKAKKATSQTTKPFSKCQVVDCGKPVSAPKSMIQVYL